MPTPPFILELRQVWGHRPLLLTGVVGVVVEDPAATRPRILFTRRTDTGRWALPAGILEPGEQPGEALRRELREETSIEARIDRLALVRADAPFAYPNGDQVQYLTLVFRATRVSGTAQIGDDESLEVRWFARDELTELLPDLGPAQFDRIAAALDETGPTRFR